jgi:ABC-type Na+ efflux pump permease subunit
MSTATVTDLPPKEGYASFSIARIWTLATNTVTQLVRMKILVFLVVFAVVVVAAAFAFPAMSAEQQLKLLKDVVFGALQIFSIVIAIAATALLLPRDVEDRTLYTILSKPVPRHEYLIGKLLGVILLLGAGLLIMDVIFSGVVWLKESMMISDQVEAMQAQGGTPEQIAQAKAYIAHYGLSWSLHAGVWCVFLKASVVASVALLLSCVATSTLFTIIVSFCFTIAGQGEGLLRSFVLKSLTVTLKKICAFVLAILCPDLTLFDLVEPAVRGDVIPLGVLAEVSGFALLYIVLYTAVAYLIFVEKEL